MSVCTPARLRVIGLASAVLLSGVIGLAGDPSAIARPTSAQQARPTASHARPSTNPPGIAYTASASHGQQVFIKNLSGDKRRQLTFGGANWAWQPRWGPLGHRILYLRQRPSGHVPWELMLVRADGRHNHLLKAFSRRRGIFDMAWAPGGGRIALVMSTLAGNNDVFIYAIRADRLTRLHVNSVPDRDPVSLDWSHDGQRIVFSAVDYSDNPAILEDADLYTVAPDGTGLRQITDTPARDEGSARWSPDDNRLLFARRNPELSDCGLWVVNAATDGTDQTRVPHSCDAGPAGWSPNGKRVLVEKFNRVGNEVLRTMPVDGIGANEFIAYGRDGSYRPR